MTFPKSLVLLLTSLLFIVPALHAQDTTDASPGGAIEGVVTDGETHEPLPYATVALLTQRDSSMVVGTSTGEDGSFRLGDVEPGTYVLRISFVGYRAETVADVSVSADARHVDLGDVRLARDTAQLAAIDVSAEREYMEVGVDRTVYHPRNQPLSAGGSAQEVLENIPSVDVDLDGNISLRGSQGVSVYINGRPAPMQGDALTGFLEGLSSENIERVEVIPNPSARYEPDGSSGILNIVLARDREIGWGGSASASVNTRGRYGGSASGYYGVGPWRLHVNYSLRYNEQENNSWRYRENHYLDPTTSLHQDMHRTRGGLSNNVNTSLEYQFSEATTVTATTIFSHRNRSGDRLNMYSVMDAAGALTDRYSRATDGDRTDLSMDYRLGLEHVITPRTHQFSVEARYDHDRRSELDQYLDRVYPLDDPEAEGVIDEEQFVDEDRHARDASLRADYVRPLGENVRLEAGYQGDFTWNDQGFFSETLSGDGIFLPDTDLNHDYRYSLHRHSTFGIVRGSLGDVGVQLGLRAEQASSNFYLRSSDEDFRNSYLSLFPSVHVSYELTEQNSFSGSYSKRVRRPRERQLNPFADMDDRTFIRVGNPYLTPQFTHSGELSYSRLGENYTLTLSPYMRYTVDEISWYEDVTDDGVSIRTADNFRSRYSYGAEVVGSFTLNRSLQGRASLNAYQRVTEAGDLASELSNEAFGFRTRVSTTARLFSGMNLQLSQFYSSPMDVPGGRISARARTDVALQMNVLDGNGRLNLRVRDLFDSTDNLIERDMERYYLEYFRDRRSRQLQLSFRYTFSGSSGDGERERGGRGRGGRGGPPR